ncbi:MAG: alpha-L-fucosidase [Verrucomicrobia bacterium]|nr:alpha-L-fucosidase [Verrucomicrobiota bacterium]
MKNVPSHMCLAMVGLLCAGSPWLCCAQTHTPTETAAQREARMAWWREARFGMFVHWGLYSGLAGTWEGKPVGTSGGMEWIENYVKADTDTYGKAALPLFRPGPEFAREWARLARQAGCRYLVFTTKHHEGFALHDSQAGDFNAGAKLHRDLVKEIVAAVQAEGLRVGFYHSVIDWHHDQYAYARSQQLPHPLYRTPEAGWASMATEGYLPHLDPRFGDFITPEQHIPATGMPAVDWETCMTMNTTWGYSDHDNAWKSSETLIRNLVDIASKGGNYLLNIGPKGDGSVPQESVQSLRAIGDWMKINGEAIYATTASPFAKLDWGRCTLKRLPDGNSRLYLHIFNWPKDGQLTLPGLANRPLQARLLASGKILKTSAAPAVVTITLPDSMPDKIATVVALGVEGAPRVTQPPTGK